jgi:polyphosphate kinase 2 (PPK2 family)
MRFKDLVDQFRVPAGTRFKLKNHDPAGTGTDELKELSADELKDRAKLALARNLAELEKAQNLLYADNRYAVLIVLQALDAAGKDGTIKHVMSGVNPQGCQVFSFKAPSAEELDHDFLWRYARCLPERGRIGIFNRSYYEDVLVVKVHPELVGRQLPRAKNRTRSSGRRGTRTSTRSSATWCATAPSS